MRSCSIKTAVFLSCIFCTAALYAGCTENIKKEKPRVHLTIMSTPQWKGVFSAPKNGGSAGYADFLNYAAQKFAAQYSDADITYSVSIVSYADRYEKVFESYGTAAVPDVFFEGLFNMNDSIHQGRILPLDDIIDNAARGNIAAAIWKNAAFGEHIYFYPYMGMPVMLVYNAALFRRAGLEEYIGGTDAVACWSVDNLNTILAALRNSMSEHEYPMSLFAFDEQGDTYTMMLLRMFGNPVFADASAVLNDKAGKEALDWIHAGIRNGYFPPYAASLRSADCDKLFSEGKIGISFTSAGLYNRKQEIPAELPDYTDIRLANFPNKARGSINGDYLAGFSAFNTGDEAKMRAAKDFIRFVCTDAELLMGSKNSMPIHRYVLEKTADDFPLFRAYAESRQYLIDFTDGIPGYTKVRRTVYPLMQQFFNGCFTSAETAEVFDARCNKVIQSRKTSSIIYK